MLSEKPRDPKKGILTRKFMTDILVQGALIAAVTMTAFHIGLRQGDSALASTMAFATLTAARLFHGFNCRSKHSIFRIGFSGNWYSLAAFAAGMVFLNLVLFVPVLKRLFLVSTLTSGQFGMIYLLAVIPTVIIQIYKIIREQ